MPVVSQIGRIVLPLYRRTLGSNKGIYGLKIYHLKWARTASERLAGEPQCLSLHPPWGLFLSWPHLHLPLGLPQNPGWPMAESHGKEIKERVYRVLAACQIYSLCLFILKHS